MQLLGPPIDLPAAEDIERFAVHDEDAWRAFRAVLTAAAKRADVDALRPTMDGMGRE